MTSALNSGETNRLFVAVMLSPELVESVRRIQSRARIDLPRGIRWVRPNQAHLTFAFLGDVQTELIPELVQSLKSFAQEKQPLSFEMRGIDGFPRANRPRVVWAGLRGESVQPLIKWHEEFWSAISHLTAPSEFSNSEFRPHITLARVPGAQPPRLAEWMTKHAGWNFGNFTINKFVLMRSELTNDGPVYEPIAEQLLS